MNKQEAVEWLHGSRSMINVHDVPDLGEQEVWARDVLVLLDDLLHTVRAVAVMSGIAGPVEAAPEPYAPASVSGRPGRTAASEIPTPFTRAQTALIEVALGSGVLLRDLYRSRNPGASDADITVAAARAVGRLCSDTGTMPHYADIVRMMEGA